MKKRIGLLILLALVAAALLIGARLRTQRVDDVLPVYFTATAPALTERSKSKRDLTTPRAPQSGHDMPLITPAGPTATLYSYP
jgi:hypothetical protein